VAETKRLLHTAATLDFHDGLEQMRHLSDRLVTGPEGTEGMAAFREKRPPSWQSNLD
jgi:methylglutaconyl-CoA hydratase